MSTLPILGFSNHCSVEHCLSFLQTWDSAIWFCRISMNSLWISNLSCLKANSLLILFVTQHLKQSIPSTDETTTVPIRGTQCSCPQKTGQPHPPSGALPWSRSLMCCYLYPVSEITPTQDPGPLCIPAALAYGLYSCSQVHWCLHNQQAVINH